MTGKNYQCTQCGRVLVYGNHGLYCSDACKQKAYRARRKAEDSKPLTFGEREVDERSRVEKAIDTKLNERRTRRCPHCWNEFQITGLQKARRYCSDACKQAAYRERNAWKNPTGRTDNKQAPTEIIPIEDNVSKIVNDAWESALDD